MNLGKSRVGRWGLLGVSLAVGLLLVVFVWVLAPATEVTATEESVQSAHVVVQFADGDTAVRPISWTGTITRLAALEAAGFTIETSYGAVCNIGGDGCPVDDCWCANNLWAQGRWDGRAWDTATWPPPDLVDGDVIAFRNGTQPDYSDWGLTGLLPGAPTYVAASDALEWMRGEQEADGGYVDAGGATGASVRALIALGAAGYDPDEWGSPSLLYYLTVVSPTETAEYASTSAASAGKLAVGAAWTGQTVTDFAGLNLPISVTNYFSATTGGYGAGSGDTAWAMLGLAAMGEAIPPEPVEFLYGVQNADGGWAWNEWGTSSEAQHTALVVQALLAAGERADSAEIVDAMALVESARNSDGGYAYIPGQDSDIGSTATVVQALLSTGTRSGGNWCATIENRYLLGVQQPDGSYPGALSDLYSTQEAIPALMQRSFGPLADYSYNCFTCYLPAVYASD